MYTSICKKSHLSLVFCLSEAKAAHNANPLNSKCLHHFIVCQYHKTDVLIALMHEL